ncbi:YfaZ precursor [Moritella viscosa]|nr:YfaZ precursor [Moritella viscosa]
MLSANPLSFSVNSENGYSDIGMNINTSIGGIAILTPKATRL